MIIACIKILVYSTARGVDTRDTYDLDAYIRTLKEQLDNLNSVRNKEPSTTQDDRVLSEATTNFLLREGALERRLVFVLERCCFEFAYLKYL